jgi:hypothetical protein
VSRGSPAPVSKGRALPFGIRGQIRVDESICHVANAIPQRPEIPPLSDYPKARWLPFWFPCCLSPSRLLAPPLARRAARASATRRKNSG